MLLPSDTHRKLITSIKVVSLPLVMYLLTLPRIYISSEYKKTLWYLLHSGSVVTCTSHKVLNNAYEDSSIGPRHLTRFY
jgi:hypothetical protein